MQQYANTSLTMFLHHVKWKTKLIEVTFSRVCLDWINTVCLCVYNEPFIHWKDKNISSLSLMIIITSVNQIHAYFKFTYTCLYMLYIVYYAYASCVSFSQFMCMCLGCACGAPHLLIAHLSTPLSLLYQLSSISTPVFFPLFARYMCHSARVVANNSVWFAV